MRKNQTVVFRELELNPKMLLAQQEQEKSLFRHIRRNYVNRTLSNPFDFGQVVQDVRERIERINASRLGRGHYLHVDAAMPTDLSDGWLKITFLTFARAQARITITALRGEIDVESTNDGQKGKAAAL